MDTELVLNEDENASSTRALGTKVAAKTASELPTVPRAPLRERNNGEAMSVVAIDAVSTPHTPAVRSNDLVAENVLKAKPASSTKGEETVQSQAEDGDGDCFSASESEMLSAKLETMSFRNNALRSANRELESRIQDLESQAARQSDQVETLKVQLRDATAKLQIEEMEGNVEKPQSEDLIRALEMRIEAEVSERDDLRQTVEQQNLKIKALNQEQSTLKTQMVAAQSREAGAIEARDAVESDLALLHRQYKTDAFRRRYGELVHENQLLKAAVTERSHDIATIASKIESVIDEQQRAAESIAWGMQQVQKMHAQNVAEHILEALITDTVLEFEQKLLRAERETLGNENQRLREGLRRSCRELEEVKEFAEAEAATASEREKILVSNLQAAEDEVEFLMNASKNILNK